MPAMDLILHSERLILRPLTEADLDLGFDLLMDPEVMTHFGGPYSRAKAIEETALATRRGAGGAIGVWCAADRETGEKLGTGALLPLPIDEPDTNWDLVAGDDLPDAEIEIGYLLKSSAWGRGLATEICARLRDFAFETTDLPDIVAVTAPTNHASQRVLMKCGWRDEGLRRAYGHDCPGFRITRQDWLEMSRSA